MKACRSHLRPVASAPSLRARRPGERGSALLLVMVVTGVLGLLVAAFAVEARQELHATAAYRDNAASYQLARAAFAAALSEMSRMGTAGAIDEKGEIYLPPDTADRQSWADKMRVYRTGKPLGEGMYSYSIRSAGERMDINALKEQQWHRLLELACGIEEGEERTALVNSVLDWKDEDDLHRVGGAETDYYETLEYRCKNGPFTTVDELLLVKGFTREILYGEEETGLPGVGEPEPEDARPFAREKKELDAFGRYERDDGLMAGGGVAQYLVAGVPISTTVAPSPEYGYIQSGHVRLQEEGEASRWSEGEVRQVGKPTLYRVIARGWMPDSGARHAIAVVLKNPGAMVYVQEWQDNAVSTPGLPVWPDESGDKDEDS